MTDYCVHYVDGVGRQIVSEEREFHPVAYEQAIHGLQQIVLSIVRFEDGFYAEDHIPDHEVDEEASEIRLDPDSILYKLRKLYVPKQWNWDVSVVGDQIRDYSYGLRASVDCGGGVIVRCNIFTDTGRIRRFDIAHNMIHDTSDTVELQSLSSNTTSREIAHLIRWLDRTVTTAYASTVSTPTRTLDFIATKQDVPPSGSRSVSTRNRREQLYQSEWATVRNKTDQTISDHVLDARDDISQLPDPEDYFTDGPALEEIPVESDWVDGDIRLV